eukprot:scaffold10028_cov236-Isochrysis_galbana.AAC.6
MAAGALRGLGCAFVVCCWCLAPKNALRHLRTTQDVRRRSVKGQGRVRLRVCVSSALRKFRVGWLTARAGRPGLDVPDCCWVSERWVLGRAWHRAAIGGREGW